MDVLQSYFDRMMALNRQRGMTGNAQYGKGMDAALAEGYFDSYQKNKNASQDLALRQRGLDIQQQGVDISRMNAETNKTTALAGVDNTNRQLELYNKALRKNEAWQWAGAGTQALTLGGSAYLKNKEIELKTPTPALAKPTSTDYAATSFDFTNEYPQVEWTGGPNTQIDYGEYGIPAEYAENEWIGGNEFTSIENLPSFGEWWNFDI